MCLLKHILLTRYHQAHHQQLCKCLNDTRALLMESTAACVVEQRAAWRKCISQGSPEKHIDMKIFIIKDWLVQLWRPRSPPSAVCKLETKDNQWYSLKAWELESHGCRFQPESEGLITRSAEDRRRLMSESKQPGRANSTICHSGTQWIGLDWMVSLILEAICFYSVHWFKCWPFPETSSQTHPEITFNR